jgi:hypothetical protein
MGVGKRELGKMTEASFSLHCSILKQNRIFIIYYSIIKNIEG